MTASGVPSLRAARGRKLLHLSTALLPVAWAYGLVDATMVRAALAGAVAVALGVETARRFSAPLRVRFEALVGPLLKPHESRSITGATWLAVAMLLAVFAFPDSAAKIALWAGAVGDSTAALVGRAWQVRIGSAAAGKSFAGFVAGAVLTALGALWLGSATMIAAIAIGVVAAIAEWPRRWGDDNLRVTLVAGGAAWLLGVG